MAEQQPKNLYVHFPFCRRKCTYCALPSRAGVAPDARAAYVARLARALAELSPEAPFSTVYFGGGSPALCDLAPLGEALGPFLDGATEFTVELHPLDVTDARLDALRSLGVNRVSMGVQSLDDGVLAHMGRGYAAAEAERAFRRVKAHFDNAGIDLIVGYPGDSLDWLERLADWGLRHCSVYSLILEEGSILARLVDKRARDPLSLPDDDTVMDRIRAVARFLGELGLERYEISNYAVPGYECRHNLATWRGEDYIGLGDGAAGRLGRSRTRNFRGESPVVETLSAEEDEIERRIFSLRTKFGLDAAGRPEWEKTLDRFAAEGLLTREGSVYRLTERGTEVCDALLAELV